ncbi:MAG: 2-C-methyl-D-erythritol 4-phosphate cytidylyltransferase [Clostridiales bacterium]|jgi:2-C-methyl-D-erythritol 4-phosphate cytidylyltransferase|nr:2-C-methyl-D-erythritol 4-phosphate cytidylyltransferase [Clostridiales bacterium]MDN5282678.1 2-C-methyl-D-erythritol 4-phosphate cytidylyltransferase [Candidatus Ozemobacter sp.]
MPQKGSVTALIVAGGMGTRMNTMVPKQFLALKGKPVVQWSLECFDQTPGVDKIVLVLPNTWLDEGRDKLISFDPIKPFKIVAGGERRQDSVKAGLDSITDSEGWVIIHDGARPRITPDLISRALKTAKTMGNAVCAIPSHDTLVRVVDGKIVDSIDRNEIYRIQTPQIFKLSQMRKAIANAIENDISATDDAGLIRELGERINLVEGSELNSKVTRPEDLDILESLL